MDAMNNGTNADSIKANLSANLTNTQKINPGWFARLWSAIKDGCSVLSCKFVSRKIYPSAAIAPMSAKVVAAKKSVNPKNVSRKVSTTGNKRAARISKKVWRGMSRQAQTAWLKKNQISKKKNKETPASSSSSAAVEEVNAAVAEVNAAANQPGNQEVVIDDQGDVVEVVDDEGDEVVDDEGDVVDFDLEDEAVVDSDSEGEEDLGAGERSLGSKTKTREGAEVGEEGADNKALKTSDSSSSGSGSGIGGRRKSRRHLKSKSKGKRRKTKAKMKGGKGRTRMVKKQTKKGKKKRQTRKIARLRKPSLANQMQHQMQKMSKQQMQKLMMQQQMMKYSQNQY